MLAPTTRQGVDEIKPSRAAVFMMVDKSRYDFAAVLGRRVARSACHSRTCAGVKFVMK